MVVLEVDRSDLHRSRLTQDDPPLGEGQARLRVDRFALTSNNITYGAFGDALQYWDFFPAAEAGWGRIPVWGFAVVTESRAPDVELGQRVYGYLPMADELLVTPGRVDPTGFTDLAEHRRPMAGTYNRYLRTDADPIHDDAREGQQAVLWPLFFTSFLIDDALGDADLFGASTVVLSSASSKTSIGTAHLLHQRPGLRVVGLTSRDHWAFVAGLGCYDDVVTYDELGVVAVDDAVYVDVAGNADVRAAVHRRFEGHLAHSMAVGGTHWDHQPADGVALVGPAPEFFFAPTHVAKRNDDWGRGELERRVGDAWRGFSAWTDEWLELRDATGPAEVEATYHELLDGRSDPSIGHVCTMAAR